MRDGIRHEKTWEIVLAYGLVPGTVAAGLTASVLMMDAGVAPAAVALPISIAGLLFSGVMERVLPWNREWHRNQGDLRNDLLYVPLHVIVPPLCAPLAIGVAIASADAISGLFGGGIWPTGWPVALQVVLATVVREFFDYWAHRVMHKVDWLWRLHVTHHQPGRVYFLNGTRAHPLEVVSASASSA